MGRKQINRTKEEIRKQNRIRAKRFYEKNKKRICERRMQRYWKTVCEAKKLAIENK